MLPRTTRCARIGALTALFVAGPSLDLPGGADGRDCTLGLGRQAAAQDRVLFIRGGQGTSSFGDDELCDVFDHDTSQGNHGWGELREQLEADGFVIEQLIEGPFPDSTPVDLSALDLSDYDVIVFGSNNAGYPPADTQRVADWVCQGGGALFISDRGFGKSWGAAPCSDQPFLDHFDLVMNQDRETYALDRNLGDFVVGGVDHGLHPILVGPDGLLGTADDVNAFKGEGVSPLTLTHGLDNVDPVVLVRAKNMIRINDEKSGGSLRPSTDEDAALVVLEYGAGRVAGHYDRNTFFNANGQGSDLHEFDNRQYARNLFAWLADAPGLRYGEACPGVGGFQPELSLEGCPRAGADVTLKVTGGLGGAWAILLAGLDRDEFPLANGCDLLITPVIQTGLMGPLGGVGPGAGQAFLPASIPLGFPPTVITLQVFLPDGGPADALSSTNGLELPIF